VNADVIIDNEFEAGQADACIGNRGYRESAAGVADSVWFRVSFFSGCAADNRPLMI
jgi:hypothetical protein